MSEATLTTYSRYAILATLVLLFILICTIVVGRYIWQINRMGRLKLDLLSTVSHELKTPLSSTRLLLDNILQDADNDMDRKEIDEYIAIIDKENHRLINIVNNFLAFSKIENKSLPVSLDIYRLGTLIKETLESMQPLLQQTSTQISFNNVLNDEINIDITLTQLMLTNLIENTIKYNSAPRIISISCISNESSLTLSIKDNGIGMTKNQQRQIFQRYYRAENTLTRYTQGSGLGLSIVAWACQQQNISVAVNSQLGKGSTFSLTFTRCANESQ